MSTHSPDGSVADDEPVEVCELSPLVLVLDVPPVAVDEEGGCSVVEPEEPEEPAEPVEPLVPDAVPVVVPPVSTPTATDVETVRWDWDRAALFVVDAAEAAESVWIDEPVVVDAEPDVRRCEAILVEGVVAGACCASAGVAAGRPSSEEGSSTPPMALLSGEVAAWVRVLDCWFITETVRPPPTRATAVATTALRWFFFQRARWRRRAARPSVVTGASSTSSDARPGSASPVAGSSWRPASCHVGASSQAAAAPVGA
ncbi:MULTISPECIES: hypothetical protein [unclassified Streptomyces]|uniref:hypothetical protein n=1 Tax=unclassified Streptomyces TaxID=2593676 RepID=UPI002476F1A1|nr:MULTISPECIES: hypothetical protein [unclassified Streptomyces]